ncbi:UbiX family flavin prenyltransferase [Breznakia pachnodae]|uniref:Flavin prenyltransferase UbiX n=1 Tax=Breznakia pachnodae TaxID=265178 RepID=A0ABU0E104_9FIRM|nr:UbiX family flavin prenyltransferase [Breznakia pachnodae]MDQ0360564.1 4-hydroxy-3-polyprenylbenzoate decarboxylase [Breznakia pachnodae]
MKSKKRLIVGISGASGVQLGYRLLKVLKELKEFEVHLIVSEGAKETMRYELSISYEELIGYADIVHDNNDIAASIASGSYESEGMIIIPASMKTVSALAHGYADSLLQRAADVVIKEKRRLVIVPREMPMSAIHLDNLSYLAKLQDIHIIPPMLTYYNHPESIEDMELHIIGKLLSKFSINIKEYKRWKENNTTN